MLPRVRKRRRFKRSSNLLNVVLAVALNVTALKDDVPEEITAPPVFPGSLTEQCGRMSRIRWSTQPLPRCPNETILKLFNEKRSVKSDEMLTLTLRQLKDNSEVTKFGYVPERLQVFLLALRSGVVRKFVKEIRSLKEKGLTVFDNELYESFVPATLSCYLLDRFQKRLDWFVEDGEIRRKLLRIPTHLYKETQDLIQAIDEGRFRCCSLGLKKAFNFCPIPTDVVVDLTELEDDFPDTSPFDLIVDEEPPVASVSQLVSQKVHFEKASSFISCLWRIPYLTSKTENSLLTLDLVCQYFDVKDGRMLDFVQQVRRLKNQKSPVRANAPHGPTIELASKSVCRGQT